MEDEDFDDHLDTLVVAYKKGSKWVVIGAFFELIGDFFRSFAKFFDTCTDASLTKFKYERQQQEFQQQASREIEMLTSGAYNATTTESGRGVGAGSAE
jgi:hypothetical protein